MQDDDPYLLADRFSSTPAELGDQIYDFQERAFAAGFIWGAAIVAMAEAIRANAPRDEWCGTYRWTRANAIKQNATPDELEAIARGVRDRLARE